MGVFIVGERKELRKAELTAVQGFGLPKDILQHKLYAGSGSPKELSFI
jgi:hypothetical protein